MSDLLMPAENMALIVARAQVERGENPTQNVSTVLVMALDRLIDKLGGKVLYELDRSSLGILRLAAQRDGSPGLWPAGDQLIDAGILVQVLPEVDRG